MLIVIAGGQGVGKSEAVRILAPRLGVPRLSPDDYPDRWAGLYGVMFPALLRGSSIIVECVAMPRALRSVVTDPQTRAVVLELTATDEVRAERLRARGATEPAIESWLRPLPIGYEDDVAVATTIDTTELEPADVADRIQAALLELAGVG